MLKNEGYSVKREIMNAVILLMGKKNYMDITVTEIINKAGVARASFYRNFNSISDVIDALVKDATDEIVEDIFPILSGTDERAWREFLFHHFYHFSKMKNDMQKIGPENMSVIFTRMTDQIRRRECDLPQGTIREKYQATAKWGLINNVLQKWLDTGAKETPEEMIDYIMSFIMLF